MKRHYTADKQSSVDPPGTFTNDFHTTQKVGRTRHKTPEGFLLCKDVAIARTGWMIYAAGETPIKVNDMGYATVARDEATLFADTTINSFVGKPVTNNHPPKGVDPGNWRRAAVGTVHNVRRGTGDDANLLLGDLLIMDAQAIADVEAGKVEVSAGYEANYEATGYGEGKQLNILGNHVALVARGRCGPRCAIGDSHHSTTKGKTMPKARVQISAATAQLVQDAATALAEEGEQENEDGQGGVHVHIHNSSSRTADADPDDEGDEGTQMADTALNKRLTAMETSLKTVVDSVALLVKGGVTGDMSAMVTDAEGSGIAGDSRALETGYRAIGSDAEILVPGFQLPTFDAAAPRARTVDAMCSTRRRALDAFQLTGDGARVVSSLTGQTQDTSKMTCVEVAQLFKSSAGAMKLMNNRAHTGDARHVPNNGGNQGTPAKRMTISELQAANAKLYPRVGA